MAALSRSGQFVRTNAWIQRLLGYSARELSALSLSDLLHHDETPIEIDEPAVHERRLVRKGGVDVWTKITIGEGGSAATNDLWLAVIEDLSQGRTGIANVCM